MNPAQASDRVRANTPTYVNAAIDRDLAARVRYYASLGPGQITRRIEELEAEWDVERWLQTLAPSLALGGLALGLLRSRRWLVLPGIVLPFLLQHAVQGWCPPLPILRRMGVRTREEIERERYALKVLRGDFEDTAGENDDESASRAAQVEQHRAQHALRAVFAPHGERHPYANPG